MRFDYVVVGAGSSGCALAARLAEAGDARVALIEAGPAGGGLASRIPAAWSKLFKSRLDWDYATVPQSGLDGRRIYWPRGRMVGGCSAMNAQMYVRGAAADFDAWAAAGNTGWDFHGLLPYFRASEGNSRGADRFHGAEGPQRVCDPVEVNPLTRAFLTAGGQCGMPANPDFNGADLDGVGLVQVAQRAGVRSSAADYLAGRPRNLTVLTDALVLRVLMDGSRATGVAIRRGAGAEQRVEAAREVILSAGAVGSPQLLMLSGIGPGEELRRHGIPVRHELNGVGAGLEDHVVAPVWAATRGRDSLLAAESPASLLRYLLRRRGMLASNAAEAAAFLRSRPDLPAPDIELIFVPVLFQGQGLVKPDRHGVTIGVVALQPASRGRIRLSSADPAAKPLIDPAYLADARDLDTLRRGVGWALRLLAAPALAERVTALLGPTTPEPAAIDTHIRRHAHTVYHPVGTCRMGREVMSVVGPDLCVHGLAGLRVADASVMPRLMRGHPHAAALAIGERAAALVRAAGRAAELAA